MGKLADKKGPPRRIFIDFKNPITLQHVGPIFIGQWRVPVAMQEALITEGKPVPQPVTGHFLVDTGASRTCISAQAAADLGLKPTGKTQTHGAGGVHINLTYFARFLFNISHAKRGSLTFEGEQPTMAIPNLDEALVPLDAQQNGKPIRIIGLLGRDFLRHCRFSYDGAGNYEIIVNTETLNQVPGQPK